MLDPVLKEKVLERWPFKAPRELLQQIGTDLFRNYIPETWVESWKMKVRNSLRKARPSTAMASRSSAPAWSARTAGS
jgi:hypothetical protein